MKSKPIAVLISDVHYSLQTLELADASMRMAIDKANELGITLIVAGDLHDTKANMRAECVNAMIETFKRRTTRCYVIVGNHDRINEKSPEHSLEFLRSLVELVTEPTYVPRIGACLLPYYHDSKELVGVINKLFPKESRLIMHQGVHGSYSGDYFQDKSAISIQDVAGHNIISGHYHRRQTIELPDGGTWDYIGNPYTLNFGEVSDPPKGFQLLMSDGSLEFVPTGLRKHVKFEINTNVMSYPYLDTAIPPSAMATIGDLLLVRVHGTKESLHGMTKDFIKELWPNTPDFKLELIPTDSASTISELKTNQSQEDQLDAVIDTTSNMSDEQKRRIKDLWKGLK